MTMYNHAASISFSFDSKNSESLGPEDVPAILDALKYRLRELHTEEVLDAIEVFDTYAFEEDEDNE